jgi:hypothetical protein
MRIGNRICSLLADDPTTWSKHAPSLPPSWYEDEVTKFADVVRLAAIGEMERARVQLSLVRSDDLRTWYGHAEKVGYFRCHHFGGRQTKARPPDLDPQRSTKRHEPFVYERDHYRCRYCNCRVIPNEILKLFSKVIGPDLFGIKGHRLERHGVAVACHACADHVVSHCRGGRTNAQNLVTACWPCNFAKADYTLEEIGIEDPFLRPPLAFGDWDGLMSFVPQLQQSLSNEMKTTRTARARPRTRSATPSERGTVKGVGGVSIVLLYSWLREWEENGEQCPASWTPHRCSFVRRNLETIRAQTKGFGG